MVFNISLKENSITKDKKENRVIRIELVGDWTDREENFARALANLLAASTISRHPAILPFMCSVMTRVGIALLGFTSKLDLDERGEVNV